MWQSGSFEVSAQVEGGAGVGLNGILGFEGDLYLKLHYAVKTGPDEGHFTMKAGFQIDLLVLTAPIMFDLVDVSLTGGSGRAALASAAGSLEERLDPANIRLGDMRLATRPAAGVSAYGLPVGQDTHTLAESYAAAEPAVVSLGDKVFMAYIEPAFGDDGSLASSELMYAVYDGTGEAVPASLTGAIRDLHGDAGIGGAGDKHLNFAPSAQLFYDANRDNKPYVLITWSNISAAAIGDASVDFSSMTPAELLNCASICAVTYDVEAGTFSKPVAPHPGTDEAAFGAQAVQMDGGSMAFVWRGLDFSQFTSDSSLQDVADANKAVYLRDGTYDPSSGVYELGGTVSLALKPSGEAGSVQDVTAAAFDGALYLAYLVSDHSSGAQVSTLYMTAYTPDGAGGWENTLLPTRLNASAEITSPTFVTYRGYGREFPILFYKAGAELCYVSLENALVHAQTGEPSRDKIGGQDLESLPASGENYPGMGGDLRFSTSAADGDQNIYAVWSQSGYTGREVYAMCFQPSVPETGGAVSGSWGLPIQLTSADPEAPALLSADAKAFKKDPCLVPVDMTLGDSRASYLLLYNGYNMTGTAESDSAADREAYGYALQYQPFVDRDALGLVPAPGDDGTLDLSGSRPLINVADEYPSETQRGGWYGDSGMIGELNGRLVFDTVTVYVRNNGLTPVTDLKVDFIVQNTRNGSWLMGKETEAVQTKVYSQGKLTETNVPDGEGGLIDSREEEHPFILYSGETAAVEFVWQVEQVNGNNTTLPCSGTNLWVNVAEGKDGAFPDTTGFDPYTQEADAHRIVAGRPSLSLIECRLLPQGVDGDGKLRYNAHLTLQNDGSQNLYERDDNGPLKEYYTESATGETTYYNPAALSIFTQVADGNGELKTVELGRVDTLPQIDKPSAFDGANAPLTLDVPLTVDPALFDVTDTLRSLTLPLSISVVKNKIFNRQVTDWHMPDNPPPYGQQAEVVGWEAGRDVLLAESMGLLRYDDGTATVTFDSQGGTAIDPLRGVVPGECAVLPVPTRSGYAFDGWKEPLSGVLFTGETPITGDVTLIAKWTKVSGGGSGTGTGGTVTRNPDGSVTTTVTNRSTGSVTETTKYPDGRVEILVTNKDGGRTYTETRPSGVTVSAQIPKTGDASAHVTLPERADAAVVSFPVNSGTVVLRVLPDGTAEPIPYSLVADGKARVLLVETAELRVETRKDLFDDTRGSWSADYADFMGARDLFSGTAPRTFSPAQPMTRAMLVTVLHRLDGKPEAGGAVFSDVKAGAWYADGVAWAAENGVTSGIGGGRFGTERSITRQELAAMLWNYAKHIGLDVSVGEDTNILSYTDAAKAAEWAIPALQWACGAGILQGKQNNVLDPAGTATRAEVAAMLQRFITSAVK